MSGREKEEGGGRGFVSPERKEPDFNLWELRKKRQAGLFGGGDFCLILKSGGEHLGKRASAMPMKRYKR